MPVCTAVSIEEAVTDMTVGNREIFGPVTCIKRVKDYEEGIRVMNGNPFAGNKESFFGEEDGQDLGGVYGAVNYIIVFRNGMIFGSCHFLYH